MPPNFQNSKIYTIRSHQTKRVFVGTTTQALHKAFYEHKKLRHASRDIMQFADLLYIDISKITRVFPLFYFDISRELNQREGELIRRLENGDSIPRYTEG